VRFRWLDADGQVLDQDDAVSAVCSQDDLRPDLVPRRIDVQPAAGDTGQHRYGVLVRNAGATASGAFGVRLDVPGLPSATATATALGSGESRVVTVTAPACAPGDTVTAVVDPAGLVDEADEDANVVSVACPE
jgi:subtilase family serine protease